MRRRERGISVALGGGSPWVLLAIGLLAGACYLVVTLSGRTGPGSADLATGPVGSTFAACRSPATAPLSATVPATATAPKWTPPRFTARQAERDDMVRTIRRRYRLQDPAVLKVMAAVPRHEFVLRKYSGRAYEDNPLPIDHGQTISQPYMVAEMTRLLKLKPSSRVLEIGTGSGYQAAVLAHFTQHVYTIEIIKPLAAAADKRLKRLRYRVIDARAADGYYGWKDKAPFDAIIVTAAAGQIPPPLIRQLKPGGRMVIPVGSPFAVQTLMLVEKGPDGKVRSRALMPVRFVPMLGAVREAK